MKLIIKFMHSCMIRITPLLILVTMGFVLSGCAALQEAQQRRDERNRQKQRPDLLMLKPVDANINIDTEALRGESDHYILTFAEDLLVQNKFNQPEEREVFVNSALGYMESLYAAMYDIFGFKPKHKIHVKLHHLYKGGRMEASTGSYVSYKIYRGEVSQSISSIEMDFPISMYESHGTRVHELTHAFTNIYFLPVWFSEGIAVLMQAEYARDRSHPKFDSLERHLKLNRDGVNQLEGWRGHGDQSGTSLSSWRYSYAYTVVSELRKRYGHDFYIRVFELMDKDSLHKKLVGRMSTSFVVYYFSQAAGEDLVPFFEKLQFKVKKLEKADILKEIEQTKDLIRRRN